MAFVPSIDRVDISFDYRFRQRSNTTYLRIFLWDDDQGIKVGGTDLQHEPNILIINTFKDIDKGADWGEITTLFPNVKMEDMSPWKLCTDTDRIFLLVVSLGFHHTYPVPDVHVTHQHQRDRTCHNVNRDYRVIGETLQ